MAFCPKRLFIESGGDKEIPLETFSSAPARESKNPEAAGIYGPAQNGGARGVYGPSDSGEELGGAKGKKVGPNFSYVVKIPPNNDL